ncbi:PilN domain-containing protein [Bacillus sp. N9]
MLPDINLLPKHEEERSVLFFIFIGGMMIALCTSFFIIYKYVALKNELNLITSQNNELTIKKETLEEKFEGSADKGTLEHAVVYAEKYVVQTSKLIDELIDYLPNTAHMSVYSYKFNDVEITVHFENKTDISSYVAKLSASDLIKDVKVNRIESEVGDSGYQVICSFQINRVTLKRRTTEMSNLFEEKGRCFYFY